MHNIVNFSVLVGQTLKEIQVDGDERITFTTQEGQTYVMYHEEICCESVHLTDIPDNWNDFIGTPILSASEDSNYSVIDSDSDDDEEWTFYNLRTIRGSATIRWYGSSNGYYSTSVSFCETT